MGIYVPRYLIRSILNASFVVVIEYLGKYLTNCVIFSCAKEIYRRQNCSFILRHTKSGGVLRYTLRTLSVRPSLRRPSVSASFRCSNFSTFWPIIFKLCIDIGIGKEWYGFASGLIPFWNNRVMALDVCQKFFVLRFRALSLVPFYRFSSNFA